MRFSAGDEHHGGGGHVGGGDAGGQVGGPRAGGGEAHSHLAGGAGIAVGGVGGPLLVSSQNVVNLVLIVVKLVIEVQDGPAGIPKDGVHLLLQQALQDGLGRSYFHKHASKKCRMQSAECRMNGRYRSFLWIFCNIWNILRKFSHWRKASRKNTVHSAFLHSAFFILRFSLRPSARR